MQICRLQQRELSKALDLIEEVFDEFEKPIYKEVGVKTFKYFIRYENMLEKINQGEMFFYVCYVENEMAGVIALRNPNHISLLFVRKKYHRQGIAKKLFAVAKYQCQQQNPDRNYITVNASPYAVGAYERMGFIKMGEQREEDGILFTPMVCHLIQKSGF